MRCRALVLAALGAGCVEVPGPAPVVCLPGADADGDGWACDARLPDCDDDDDGIHPGADEIAGDGIDQDCLRGDPAPEDMLVGVAIDETGDNPEVAMPGAWLRFPSTGARFPDELVVGLLAWDVLYKGPDLAAGMGIALDPLFRTTDVADAPRIEIVAAGPALGIGHLTWANDAGGAAIEGTSYLWFFPDGRIVRHDRVDVNETITGSDLDLSAYVSLATGPFTHLRWNGLADGVPLQNIAEGEIWSEGPEQDGFLCLYDQVSGGMTGFGWYTDGVGGGPRAVHADGGVTFSWDWLRGAPQVDNVSYYLASVTFHDGGGVRLDCDVTARDLGLLDHLVFDPRGGTVGGEIDGSVDGRFMFSMASTQPFAEAMALDTDRTVPVHVELPAEKEHGVTVWLDGVRLAAGVDYLRQYGSSDAGTLEVFLYLPEIGADQMLRVAAMGGEP